MAAGVLGSCGDTVGVRPASGIGWRRPAAAAAACPGLWGNIPPSQEGAAHVSRGLCPDPKHSPEGLHGPTPKTPLCLRILGSCLVEEANAQRGRATWLVSHKRGAGNPERGCERPLVSSSLAHPRWDPRKYRALGSPVFPTCLCLGDTGHVESRGLFVNSHPEPQALGEPSPGRGPVG